MNNTALIIEFIVALSVLIILHELGHFFMGRLFHVDIEEFGIGYPPKLAKLFEWNGIAFTINWIPFGGFTRFKGEDDATVSNGLASSNKWKRLGILLGGSMMNFLAGIILFSVVFSSTGFPVEDTVVIQAVEPNSPAFEAGMQAGDILYEVMGEKIDRLDEVSPIIREHLGEEVPISILRGEEIILLTITPRTEWPEDQGPIGIVMSNPIENLSFFNAIPRSISMAYEQSKQLLSLPIKIIRGEVNTSDARVLSPKGVYDIYAQVREEEIAAELDAIAIRLNTAWFFGIISIGYGITNLLPIPALDGGRILFLLPEIFIGKRVPQKFEYLINAAGFFLLILLMFYVFLQDIVNPVVLP